MPLNIKGTSAGGFTVKGDMAGTSATNVKNYLPSQETGVFLWLRGDLGITLAGTKVQNWANQGTAGGTFIQNTAASQPVYNSQALSGSAGWPSVSFTSGSHYFSVYTSNTNVVNSNSNYTFFVACNPTTSASTNQLWLMDIASLPGGSPTRIIFAHDAGSQTGKHVAYFANGSYQGTNSSTDPPGTLGSQILTFELDSAGSTIYRNGTSIKSSLPYSQVSIVTGSNGTVSFTLAAATSGGASWFDGDIFEVIGVSNTTAGMRQRIESYLVSRYGIY
jgi:hypothetical protein